MNRRPTLVKPTDTAELAWAENDVRADIVARYYAALAKRDLSTAAEVWLEAGDYDRANPDTSSLVDELDSPQAA